MLAMSYSGSQVPRPSAAILDVIAGIGLPIRQIRPKRNA